VKADAREAKKGTVLIAAGGTGGHLFPAQALALELGSRGWRIELATDERVATYGQDFPAAKVHLIASATPSGSGAVGKMKAALLLALGTLAAMALVLRVHPKAAIGFGGYPTVPPILAASLLGVPTLVHDANAVLGRANAFLAPRVRAIAISSPNIKLRRAVGARVVETGNPVRPGVLEAAKRPYSTRRAEDPFRMLVFGGSQGARAFSELVPPALEKLDGATRARLQIVQQCRPEDLESVRQRYGALGLRAELAPFFRNLPELMAQSHLVIARSGAGTVTELAVIGRPAILVPLPGAIDQDQRANAGAFALKGGAVLIEQKDLTPQRLAAEIENFVEHPEALEEIARKAKAFGRLDAVERLADLVEAVATRNLNAIETHPSTSSG
jgi:UDP-N-acetylglucosamine--N-acetylmuramyl-(pentapeptide) pyrophosphoryl-undecaprenol N-acetylglucosamine transferase